MSQTKEILNHLRREPITPVQALNLYGCFRLAARVNDLRNKGHDIGTEDVKQNGKTYARYWLVKEAGTKTATEVTVVAPLGKVVTSDY